MPCSSIVLQYSTIDRAQPEESLLFVGTPMRHCCKAQPPPFIFLSYFIATIDTVFISLSIKVYIQLKIYAFTYTKYIPGMLFFVL